MELSSFGQDGWLPLGLIQVRAAHKVLHPSGLVRKPSSYATSCQPLRPRQLSKRGTRTDSIAPLLYYGQTFFGFVPIEKVFGSSDTNSYTPGLNASHCP